jgi:hypothetical protein
MEGSNWNVDPSKEIIILRPYGGYTPRVPFTRPLLADDDVQRRLPEFFKNTLPVDVAHSLRRAMRNPPAWILGMSMTSPHDRLLLENLFVRGFPRKWIPFVENGEQEQELWKAAGSQRDVDLVEVSEDTLNTALQALRAERAR